MRKAGWPGHNFLLKSYHILFLLLYEPEAFKKCKNTIRVLPLLGVFKERLSSWLSVQTFSILKMNNYLSVSGDSKQKSPPTKSGGGRGLRLCDPFHPKMPFFFLRRPKVTFLNTLVEIRTISISPAKISLVYASFFFVLSPKKRPLIHFQ